MPQYFQKFSIIFLLKLELMMCFLHLVVLTLEVSAVTPVTLNGASYHCPDLAETA